MRHKQIKKELTPREVTFLKSFVRTGNQTTAAIDSGSPEENARQCGWAMMRRIKSKIGERLAAKGITPDSLIDKVLLPGLEATKKERIRMGTVIQTFEDVDHEQRGKYADRIFKLVGLIGNGRDDKFGENNDDAGPRYVSLTLVNVSAGAAAAIMAGNSGGSANHQQLDLDATSHEDQGRSGSEPEL